LAGTMSNLNPGADGVVHGKSVWLRGALSDIPY
jgi:hypothetical protein